MIMKPFFYCKASKKWTWKSLNGETKNERLHSYYKKKNYNKLNTVKNVTVLNKLKSSDHRKVRCKVMLYLKREREKLFRMKRPNFPTVK